MFRSRTIQEGTVGLFALFGLVLLGGVALWLRGGGFGTQGYRFQVQFENASGLQSGAPVRFRGVTVGKVAQLLPGSNGISAVINIASVQLRMPKDSIIQIGRHGLIGEASIDISPATTLSAEALTIDPLSQSCREKNTIICNESQLQGEKGSQLFESIDRLSRAYSDPAFVENINTTIRSANLAANNIAKMTLEVSRLSSTAREQIGDIGKTTTAIANVADNAKVLAQNLNQLVVENQTQLSQTIQEATQLMGNLNRLVQDNERQVANTLIGIQSTSQKIQTLSQEMESTLKTVNRGLASVEVERVAKNLDLVLANTAETTENLRKLSTSFNDPTMVLTIQQTLDSARVTFANTQKITSDLEELTGDPVFRSNLRKLVDGLGNLVSSTEQLQQHAYTAQLLDSSSQQLQYHIDVHEQLISYQASYLKAQSPESASVNGSAVSPSPLATPIPMVSPRE